MEYLPYQSLTYTPTPHPDLTSAVNSISFAEVFQNVNNVMQRSPRTRLARQVVRMHEFLVASLFGVGAFNAATLKRACYELDDLARENDGYDDAAIFEMVLRLTERMVREASGSKHWTVERSRAEHRGRVRYDHPRRFRVSRRVAVALRERMLGLGDTTDESLLA